MTGFLRVAGWGLLALVGAATRLPSQAVPRVTLGAPVATLRHEFSSVVGLRELGDGRVLLTDFVENQLMVADFAKQSVAPVGRRGQGPGEYQLARRLYVLGGDSTLMQLVGGPRQTVATGGLAMSTLPLTPAFTKFFTNGMLIGVDTIGHYLAEPAVPTGQSGPVRDTAPLVLITRRTMRVDTIARVDGGAVQPDLRAGDVYTEPAYHTYDHKLMSPDGWVAIVRASPYRVEWRSPDGRWRTGPIIDQPTKLDAREKAAYLDRRRKADSADVVISSVGGAGNTSGASGPPRPYPPIAWPETIPPFMGGGPPSFMTSSGEVLVPRTPRSDLTVPVYDVINRQGIREYQLALTTNQQIIGFGKGAIYVVSLDVNDVQTLHRYRWPAR